MPEITGTQQAKQDLIDIRVYAADSDPAAVAALFAANVSAVEIYHGLEDGNSDLSTQRVSANDFAGVQPSIGDSVERYHGWADGNPDLFKSDGSRSTSTGQPDIYMNVSGNPDLSF